MILVLFDRSEVMVSKEQADKIKQMIKNGAEWIEIKGNMYKASAIMIIKQGGYTEADKIPEHLRIDPKDYRGEYSEAKEKLKKRWTIK